MKYLLIFLALLLSGCTTVWLKDGATMANFANDKQQCALYANHLTVTAVAYAFKFSECMHERGWHKEQR